MSVVRTFMPGSEWVYYKIYCGFDTASKLLTAQIHPLCQDFYNQGIIDEWFFIRYTDPDHHLRIRFHVTSIEHLQTVLIDVRKSLQPLLKTRQIWDVQLGTYDRELERYGKNTMEHAETFFHIDGETLLEQFKKNPSELERFQFLLSYLNMVIDFFISDPKEKLDFLNRNQSSFKTEFGVHSMAKKQLGKKYRDFAKHDYKFLPNLKYEELKNTVNQILDCEKNDTLDIPLHSLLSSLIHMSINRAFPSRQRLYEMVLYDFLYQQYRSTYYRKLKKK